jgi:hypothetical protein
MAGCGPANGAETAVAVAAHDHPAFDVYFAGSAAHHHHVASAAATEHSDHGEPLHDSTHTSKCSLCASGCVSAALVPGVVPFDQNRFTLYFAAADEASALAFLTSGQERPPRAFHA